jgi:hypothetical protein
MNAPAFNTPSRTLAALAIAGALVGCATPSPPPAAMPTLLLSCEMAATPKGYAGECSVPCSVNALAINFAGVEPARACSGPPKRVQATLERTAVAGRWLGSMPGVQPEDPTRLEVVPNEGAASAGSAGGAPRAVARTPYGWFAVQRFDEGPTSASLVLDADRQVRPTAADLRIIDRARALLPNTTVWNKADNRQCPAGASQISLFCALMNATTEISGGVHYRQPAMQAVREELNRVDPARIKTHRIMDFNNHPDTTLAEVHALLQRARDRVAADMR